MKVTKRAISLVALALFVLTGQAFAQTGTTGAIQGVVTDQTTGENLLGVTIVATSPALQGEQTTVTDESGFYKITNLPPGTYEVVFYWGKAVVRRQNITVSINKSAQVYQKIGDSEVIKVIDKGPTVDPTSTSQGITLTQDYTKNIPVPGRTFEDTLGAAAGSQGDALGVSFSGSTSIENSYVVDGVNTTGLSYGTVGSPVINDFIQEIEVITGGYQAEYGRSTGGVVNVVTKSGSNEFHGSVFSYYTNDSMSADPNIADTEGTAILGDSRLAHDLNVGFDLGGPIIKDKLWFYVGFAPRYLQVDVSRRTRSRVDCYDPATMEDGLGRCDPRSSTAQNPDERGFGDGNADVDPDSGFFIWQDIDQRKIKNVAKELQFVSKLNYSLSPEHQGQVTFSGTPYSTDASALAGTASATEFKQDSLTLDGSFKWTSKFNNNKTEVEAVAGIHRSTFKTELKDSSVRDMPRQSIQFGNLGTWALLGNESPETLQRCTDGGSTDLYPNIENCPGLVYSVGGPGAITDDTEQRLNGRLNVTQRVVAAGNHEIKGGVDFEQNTAESPREFSGDAFYQLIVGNSMFETGSYLRANRWVQIAPAGTMETDVYDQECGTDRETGDAIRCRIIKKGDDATRVAGKTLNWAAYLRDSWQILPNLTFNAGVRYEEQRLRYASYLQGEVDSLTLVERGKNAMELRNMWAPRLGLLYDWTKEGRSKVFASWGRFYESIPMDINNRSFGGEVQFQQTYDTGQCGGSVMGFGGPAGQACPTDVDPSLGEELFGSSGVLVAPGIKAQYLDESIIGAEYELVEDLKVGLSYQFRTMGRVLEDVSTDAAETYIIANPGEWSEEEENKLEDRIMSEEDGDIRARLQDQLEQYRKIRSFDKPRRDYHAVQLTATKRFSKRFFAQGSYTYSRTVGNYPGLFSDDNGQVDPNISSQYDLIELLANRDGPLPQDRPHYFKLDGYYKYDFNNIRKFGELTTGARIRALSGMPYGALAAHETYGQAESFLLPRGDGGRAPWDWNIDLHLGYARELGHGMTLEAFADIFSIFNRQESARIDDVYTFDSANPVVGGSETDLIWVKQQDTTGVETGNPIGRNRNYGNTAGRYAPRSGRIGLRLTF